MRAIHLSSKLRPSAYRSATEMVFTKEMQRVDLELHLELAEPPINSAFIYVFTYCKWLRYLIFKINGEVLWKRRELKMDQTQMFYAPSEWFGVNRL